MTTFICNTGDYKIEELKQFSRNTGSNVIIRNIGKIESDSKDPIFLYENARKDIAL